MKREHKAVLFGLLISAIPIGALVWATATRTEPNLGREVVAAKVVVDAGPEAKPTDDCWGKCRVSDHPIVKRYILMREVVLAKMTIMEAQLDKDGGVVDDDLIGEFMDLDEHYECIGCADITWQLRDDDACEVYCDLKKMKFVQTNVGGCTCELLHGERVSTYWGGTVHRCQMLECDRYGMKRRLLRTGGLHSRWVLP